MNNAESKKCTKCGITKSVEDFYRKGYRHDSQCKVCVRKRKSEKRKEKKTTKTHLRTPTIQDSLNFDVTEVYVPHIDSTPRDSIVQRFIEVSLQGDIQDE